MRSRVLRDEAVIPRRLRRDHRHSRAGGNPEIIRFWIPDQVGDDRYLAACREEYH